ncbi:MAG: hypothetical protein V3S27_06905 [Kiloniellales bacterium]
MTAPGVRRLERCFVDFYRRHVDKAALRLSELEAKIRDDRGLV